jgi:hypothetical protein
VEIARKTKEEQKSLGVRLNAQWSRMTWSIFASRTNNFPSRVPQAYQQKEAGEENQAGKIRQEKSGRIIAEVVH